MPFTPVNYSQQDPAWKSIKVGRGRETIGDVGCALVSTAMLISGHGYSETPKLLNTKLKSRGGYLGAAIVWGAITSLYPQIIYKTIVLCRDTEAPLTQINASLAADQPVLVEVDSSPKAGLQSHWVVLYAKKGRDYLILDPWPYPTENGQEILLKSRYSHDKPLKRAITAVIFYECKKMGTSDSSASARTQPSMPSKSGTYLRIPVSVATGLRLRSQPTIASGTVAIHPPGALLRVVEPSSVAVPKIGVYNQWIHVVDSQGQQGYVAAWYVEEGPTIEEVTEADSPPATDTDPDTVELTIYVSQAVGPAGLRLRQTASLGGALVAVLKSGSALRVLEPKPRARKKIGVKGKWIHVMDSKGLKGYVAAHYIEIQREPLGTSPISRPASEGLTVQVSEDATAGLRLRSGPSINSSTLKILAPNSSLTVLEGDESMVGVYPKWLKVRDSQGTEGFVAAWYVSK